MQIEGLDELDQRILDVIRDHARLTYKEIGDRVGISRVSVKARMEAMQEKGIIRGYQAVIDPTQVPGGIRFFLETECSPEHYEEVVEALAASSYIRQIYSVSGECRIHAIGFAPNARSMEYFANSIYRSQRGMRRIDCRPVLSVLMDRDGGVEYVRYQEHEHLGDNSQ